MELGRAAQGLTAALVGGALSGVMDEGDGSVKVTLQVAQVSEERSDLGGGVFVDAMQANEGIEHEQFRLQLGDGGGQRLSIVVAVEPQRRHGDEVDIEAFEVGAGCGGNSLEAPAHDEGIILGGEQQHRTALTDWKASQAGATGGNRDGKIESEEGFAALGFPADDPDRLGAPQAFDQPILGAGGSCGELCGAHGRQGRHGRAPGRRGLRPSGANTSK